MGTEPCVAGSSSMVRAGVAASLIASAAAARNTRLLVGISGPGGSGKSALLLQLEEHYLATGVRVSRDPSSIDGHGSTDPAAVLIDDAHELDEETVGRLHALVDDREVDVVVAYRPWPQTPALRRLTAALGTSRPPIILGPLSAAEIAAQAEATLDRPASSAFVDRVAELTGCMPWLVHRVMEAAARDGGCASADPLASPALRDELSHELDQLDDGLRELLLAMSVGLDVSDATPPAVEQAGEDLDDLRRRARAEGLLTPRGQLVPLIRHVLLEKTPVYRVRAVQEALVDALSAQGRLDEEAARQLAGEGYRDPRVARVLEQAGDRALTGQPFRAAELYEEAAKAGSAGLTTAARRAQAALATGDLTGAGRILDDLLAHDHAPDLARGVDLAAALWAQRGMLARSAEVYRWQEQGRNASSAALAAITMIGVGDRQGAEAVFSGSTPKGSPTHTAMSTQLMGRGIRDSITDRPAHALPALVRASDMMTASGLILPLPEVPAALAALVALNSGEPGVAQNILDEALTGEQCGPAARPRLLLLHAWTSMQQDRPQVARAAMAEATSGAVGLAPREELLMHALQVGLARRTDDTAGLVRAWQSAREGVLHATVDLYNLLPFGELLVGAARLRDSRRLEPQLDEAWALLARLGDPPLWSVVPRWYAVQAAILAEQPSQLPPHAAALVRASRHSHLASRLAAAGRSWMSVLAGTVEVTSVEAAARGLASVGMAWDGSRLAGHAAAHAEERKDMNSLLACARDLQANPSESVGAGPEPGQADPTVPAADSQATDETGLSAREREVARFVLEGKTYREIGEALFISPRTAEHHIARIRRRLGVRTRQELLARLRVSLDTVDSGADAG